jgi:uncharacterized damage-inducible protein DinB
VFTSVGEMLGLWRHEASQTVRVMAALTDASLAQPVAPGFRTLGDLAWHVAGAPPHFLAGFGLGFQGPNTRVPRPERAAEIRSVYEDIQNGLSAAVETEWSDASLDAEGTVFGKPMSRGTAAMVMLHHEIHHRGQMTVLMRQAGLAVPGVYGPAKGE